MEWITSDRIVLYTIHAIDFANNPSIFLLTHLAIIETYWRTHKNKMIMHQPSQPNLEHLVTLHDDEPYQMIMLRQDSGTNPGV